MRNHECGYGRRHGHRSEHEQGREFGLGAKIAMMAMRGRGGWGGGLGGGRSGFFGGPDGDEGFGRGGGRGRGGRGRMFGSGELRLLLLKLIADQSRHGYELIKAIEELTGGEYAPSPGVVYPTLSLLVDEGKIAEAPQSDGPRKAFTVTDEGKAELETRGDEVDAVVQRLAALAEQEPRESPPIRRAVANLFIALRERAKSGGFDTDTVHAIADILDEAARKIERL
jgi:DNA-binding PadR family transcriptional regulator